MAMLMPSLTPPSKGVKTGTTIMAVEYDGGVIIGADSRTSTGSYVANRVSDKLTEVSSFVYCCRSGSAADTQAVSDIVRHQLEEYSLEFDRTPKVKVAATLFKNICYEYRDQLMAGIICAGWDADKGGSVYSIPLGGACVRQPFAIGGSGSTYLYGHCDATYRPGMTKEECQTFVKEAIALAMSRDGSSGGVIRMVAIDESGCERSFVPGDKLPY
eukprot:PLAT1071.1.p1 GENE.PLAT1071.1~~PLAT1071.1.p1  ORF type:complete len:215 (-),score=73.04 PLAT1071.1:85-729(-)